MKLKIPKILLYLLIPISLIAQSQYEITTVLKHKFFDKNGNILTGKGVVIGDIDSGIDIFHPMFFFADGGEFEWDDVNNDGKLTPGEDKISINGKETLIRYIKMQDNTWGMLEDNERRVFNPSYDFCMPMLITGNGIMAQMQDSVNQTLHTVNSFL